MARAIPQDRLERLVACATDVFIRQGYRRTQMADVAKALGVAKGTLYLYVETKEALFDLVARCADGGEPLPAADQLPLTTAPPERLLAYTRARIAQGQTMPALSAALARTRVPRASVRSELEGIAAELYDTLARNRTAIKLIDRTAQDRPDLAEVWFRSGREGLQALLSEYLRDRIRRGTLRPVPDLDVAARLFLETSVFWAVHRHWDPQPQPIDEENAKKTVLHFFVHAFVED